MGASPMPYALCPMPYALCPMPYEHLMLLRKAITLTSLSAFSAFSAVQKSNSIPQQNCFSPKTIPQQFPPEKLKTMLQLIAFECPVHGTRDKLANSDKMTDVVVSD